jgi:hypothetical protein
MSTANPVIAFRVPVALRTAFFKRYGSKEAALAALKAHMRASVVAKRRKPRKGGAK